MDEYAEYVAKRRLYYESVDPGDISEQQQMRRRMQCKPFKWYMDEIAFDVMKYIPPITIPNYGSGKVMATEKENSKIISLFLDWKIILWFQIRPILDNQLCLTAEETARSTVVQKCFSNINQVCKIS